MHASGENRVPYPAGGRVQASALSERHLVSTSENDAWLFDPGGPAPDTFEEVARMLGTAPERTVAVEDSVAGVRAGNFGVVVGVARGDDPGILRQCGADVAVRELAQLGLV